MKQITKQLLKSAKFINGDVLGTCFVYAMLLKKVYSVKIYGKGKTENKRTETFIG